MAANAVIGALRVNLGLSTAAFDKGARRARGKAKGLAVSLKKVAAGIAAAFAAAFAVVGRAIGKFLGEADKVSKAAQSIGIATDELSRLAHAASQSGVSFEALTKGLGRLAKTMKDSLRSATSEQALAFKELGISVTDAQGRLKPTSVILSELADRFSGMADGTNKAAIAAAIFGQRIGADMIPLLNQGAAGIQKLKDEADQLRLVIDEKTGKAAERFNDTMANLRKLFTGVITVVTARLAPTLNVLAEFLLSAAKESKGFELAIDLLVGAFKVLITTLIIGGKTIETIAILIRGVSKAFDELTDSDFASATETMSNSFSEVFDTMKDGGRLLAKVWSDVGDAVIQNTPAPEKVADPFKAATETIKRDMNTLVDTSRSTGSQISDAFTDAFSQLQLTGNRVLDDLLSKLVGIGASQFFKGGGLGGFGLSSAFQTGGGSSFSSNFGGFFADGGIPPAGKLSIVGENGPEFLVGDGRAAVVPSGAMGGGMEVHVHNHTGEPVEQSRRRLPSGKEVVDLVIGDRSFDQAVDARILKMDAPKKSR